MAHTQPGKEGQPTASLASEQELELLFIGATTTVVTTSKPGRCLHIGLWNHGVIKPGRDFQGEQVQPSNISVEQVLN